MNYCIVENGIIVNMIVCENDETAKLFNAIPSYETARIGEVYTPPKESTIKEELLGILDQI